ncbi:DUF6907 domain-containing protein [Streptomyces marokkonensis]|uniref:DUF6907 domain-containing protein n=1 Tax=Streptomyces marokkonensis TaxID=324855 RepID=UPI0011F0DF35|nr:hypothetical protein [Streptomyces marokkonensis]
MTARTVTVWTGDHGDVTIPEPFWCLGDHEPEGYREDVEHRGEDVVLTVPTPCHGETKLSTLTLVQRPFSPTDRDVKVTVELDGDWHDLSAGQLAQLTDSLVVLAVGPLHRFIERLQLLEAGGGQR